MDRRELLLSLAHLAAAGSVMGAAIARSEPDPELPPEQCANQLGALIDNNHGHVLRVPPDDVSKGVEKVYSIQGVSTHDHQVTVTAAQFAALQSGQTIQIAAGLGGRPPGHSHNLILVRVL